nr:hypothetical protein [Tanacetum cinerariifolium]
MFLGKVTSEYNHHETVHRTKDMIMRKWTTLTCDCNKFVAIVDENAWLSGEHDSTWQARCYKTFVQLCGSQFVHYDAWNVLKDHYKWRGVKPVRPRRRVHTTEDLEEPNELFRDDTIPRPPRKPRPSKSQRSDSSKSVGSSSTGKDPKAFKEMVQEELERYKNGFYRNVKKIEEIKFLNFSTEGMRPEDEANFERLKDEIREKHFPSPQHVVSP